jgi:acetolactate synthase-1/3 small subunit
MNGQALLKKIISILVRNRPGVLSHVAGLVTRRGFNLESIAAGPTENPAITRITLVVAGDGKTLDQVVKQFAKLIDVISVDVLPHENSHTGELAIITVSMPEGQSERLMALVSLLGLKLLDIRAESLTVMVAGSAQSVDTAVRGLSPYGIKALARTGLVALPLDGENGQKVA